MTLLAPPRDPPSSTREPRPWPRSPPPGDPPGCIRGRTATAAPARFLHAAWQSPTASTRLGPAHGFWHLAEAPPNATPARRLGCDGGVEAGCGSDIQGDEAWEPQIRPLALFCGRRLAPSSAAVADSVDGEWQRKVGGGGGGGGCVAEEPR
ncbi:hypothetical protein U9M48_004917 [Paspalum notatum var. saurae]|uniref:Uncharacterized protein n=1 Tax=Paspalum notatum var. saurae TaxID=547442 RepID=A0AAQ3PVP4_PASNO